MPKRLLKITNFDKGILLNASERDPREGFYPFAENADSGLSGQVRAVSSSPDAANSTNFVADVLGTFLAQAKQQIIGQDYSSGAIKLYSGAAITDVGNTPNTTQVQQFIPIDGRLIATCGKVNSTKHISYIDRKVLNGTVDGYFIEDNKLNAFNNVEGHIYHVEQGAYRQVSTDTSNPTNLEKVAISFISSGTKVNRIISRDGTVTDSVDTFSRVGKVYEYTDDETMLTVFKEGKSYAYAVSLIYDGYQESPLIRSYSEKTSATRRGDGRSRVSYFNTIKLAQNALGIEVELFIAFPPTSYTNGLNDYPNGMSHRVTGLNIYRAEASSLESTPEELFKFVKFFSFDDEKQTEKWQSRAVADFRLSGRATETMPNIEAGGGVKSISFYDDGFAGATYESNSGIPETLEENGLNYTQGVKVNEYLFVSGVGTNRFFDTTEGLIFRSVAGSPSSFNILNDFIQLPEPVTAIATFESRLYAYTESKTYRINPAGLYIESEFDGFGAISQNHVCATPYGICHADHSGIYLNTGSAITTISSSVHSGGYSSNVGYRDITEARRNSMQLAYDPREGRLCILGQYNSTKCKAWMYDFSRQRWDFYVPYSGSLSVDNTTIKGSAIMDSNLYVSTGPKLVEMFSSNDSEPIVLVTYDYTFNSDNGEFWLYEAIIRGQIHSGDSARGESIFYRFDGGNWIEVTPSGGNTAVTLTSDGDTHVIRFVNNVKVQSVQLLLGYFETIDSVYFRVRLPNVEE